VIIVGHCEAALGVDPSDGGRIFQHILNTTAQYAVPFFFVLAGYSLAPKLTRPGSLRHATAYSRRILTLFVGTSIFYFLLGALASAKPGDPIDQVLTRQAARMFRDPLTMVLGATGHLWFLVGLVIAVWTTAWVRSRTRLRHLIVVGGIVYAALLLTGPYAVVIGLAPLPPWRMTVFLGTPFVALGLALRHTRELPPLRTAWALIVAGLATQAAEQYWLWSGWGLSPFRTGTLMGTAMVALGVSLLAIRPGGSTVSRLIARLGPLTLVTYLIHVAFVDLLRPYRFAVDRPTARWLFPLVVAVLSFTTAAAYYSAAIAIRRYLKPRPEGISASP
jgi:surface polysaccharide O-acyltransferase-like enzyme